MYHSVGQPQERKTLISSPKKESNLGKSREKLGSTKDFGFILSKRTKIVHQDRNIFSVHFS